MHMPPTALITGITGQDGSYLADHLLAEGYEVHGVVRRHSEPRQSRIQHLLDEERITLHEGDLADGNSLNAAVKKAEPDECYNLAAQSHVGRSFTEPEHNLNITGLGALRVFEAIRHHAPNARVYQASSSEMYGQQLDPDEDGRLSEDDPFHPVSPYAAAKTLAHHLAHTYRESYDLHISCGILFNHESERRGEGFVTRKITRSLARIHLGLQDTLELGNLQAQRDWGYAPEYVQAMHRMLQEPEPGDYVVATGEAHTVREFLETAYEVSDVTQPLDEVVEIGEQHFRPADIPRLCGDPTKAEAELGWTPKVRMKDLAERMYQFDVQNLQESKHS